jgi:photosystem II stability/assembly factor-like uncharacterized protein
MRRVLTLALLVMGCHNPDLYITLAANGPLPPIAQLHLAATLDGKRQLRDIKHGDGRPVVVGDTFDVPLLPAGLRGTVELLIEAVDGGDTVLATGSASVNVDGDRQFPLRLTLSSWRDITPAWMQSGYSFGLNLWGSGPDDVYAVGQGLGKQPLLAHSRDGGNSWTAESLPCTSVCPTTLTGVWGSSASDVYAVGYSDTIAHSNGDGWTLLQIGATAATQPVLVTAWGSGASNVYIVGAHGTIEHSSDGMSFTSTTATMGVDLQSLWGSGDTLFAVGDADTVVRSNDGGQTFKVTQTLTPATSGLKNVWGRAIDDVFAVGCNGTSGSSGDCAGDGFIQHFDGSSWTTIYAVPGPTGLYGDWGSGAGELYAVGQSCTILHSIDGGQTWRSQSCSRSDVVLSAVWGNGSVVYAFGNAGTNAVMPVLLRLP